MVSMEMKMVGFSGTNLPPVVRLGGSADVNYSLREGSLGAFPSPRLVFHRHVPVATLVVPAVIELTPTKARRHSEERRQNLPKRRRSRSNR